MKFKDIYDDIYPLKIVSDRYSGTYSRGKFTAWNMEAYDVPVEISEDDDTCADFWARNEYPVGIGHTPKEAVQDLYDQLQERGRRDNW